MFLTVHSPTGALIGNAVGNPLLAFVLGMLSHFLLDKIPHWDPKGSEAFFAKKITLDAPAKRYIAIVLVDSLMVGLFTIFIITRNSINPLSIISGIAGSVLPDYLMGLYLLTKNSYLKKFQQFHNFMHFDPNTIHVNFFTGNITQISVLFISLFLLFKGFVYF